MTSGPDHVTYYPEALPATQDDRLADLFAVEGTEVEFELSRIAQQLKILDQRIQAMEAEQIGDGSREDKKRDLTASSLMDMIDVLEKRRKYLKENPVVV